MVAEAEDVGFSSLKAKSARNLSQRSALPADNVENYSRDGIPPNDYFTVVSNLTIPNDVGPVMHR